LYEPSGHGILTSFRHVNLLYLLWSRSNERQHDYDPWLEWFIFEFTDRRKLVLSSSSCGQPLALNREMFSSLAGVSLTFTGPHKRNDGGDDNEPGPTAGPANYYTSEQHQKSEKESKGNWRTLQIYRDLGRTFQSEINFLRQPSSTQRTCQIEE
jgi:hypothetical protein